MAARNPPTADRAWTPDKVRARIKTSMILNALSNHVLKGTKMDKTQVTAAVALLKKTLPDLSNVDMQVSGAGGGPIVISSTDAEL